MKKITAILSIVAVIILSQPTSAGTASSLDITFRQALSGGDVIAAINGYRQQYGLSALSENSLLTSLAQAQSNYQASIQSVTHTGPGGTTPQDRASAAGYGGGSFFYLSEIIYGGFNQTTQNALAWWQNSSLHNSIMLSSNYSEIGGGVATNGDYVYFTAVLGGPSGDSSSSSGGGDTSGSGNGASTQPTQASPVIMPIQKATPQNDGAIIHTVLVGQTLWTIAAVYEIELESLYQINGLNQYSFVFPGDQITIRLPGSYEDPVLKPTGSTATNQPIATGTLQPEKSTWVLGTAYSSLKQSTPQNLATNTQAPIVLEVIPATLQQNTGLFSGDPTARYLIIAAFIILIIVIIGSMFIQKPTSRPPEDGLDK